MNLDDYTQMVTTWEESDEEDEDLKEQHQESIENGLMLLVEVRHFKNFLLSFLNNQYWKQLIFPHFRNQKIQYIPNSKVWKVSYFLNFRVWEVNFLFSPFSLTLEFGRFVLSFLNNQCWK